MSAGVDAVSTVLVSRELRGSASRGAGGRGGSGGLRARSRDLRGADGLRVQRVDRRHGRARFELRPGCTVLI